MASESRALAARHRRGSVIHRASLASWLESARHPLLAVQDDYSVDPE